MNRANRKIGRDDIYYIGTSLEWIPGQTDEPKFVTRLGIRGSSVEDPEAARESLRKNASDLLGEALASEMLRKSATIEMFVKTDVWFEHIFDSVAYIYPASMPYCVDENVIRSMKEDAVSRRLSEDERLVILGVICKSVGANLFSRSVF